MSTMDTFYDLDEGIIDVLFLGSSHCYNAVNCSILWEQYGMGAYSLAISGQDMASSYYCLKEALKTQKPKVVCLEMFGCMFYGYEVKGNLYRNLLGYQPSLNFRDAVYSLAPEEERRDFLLKWPIIHTRYAEITKRDFTPDKIGQTYMGHEIKFDIENIGEIPIFQGDACTAVKPEVEMWLRKIIELADESGIRLCFFLAPYLANENSQNQYRYVKKIAEEKDIPFIDMIGLQSEVGIDPGRDFIDWGHANSYGAVKITDYLGRFLMDHYLLEDRRGDARYALWDESLQAWIHSEQNQSILQTADFVTYLDRMPQLEGYTAVIVTRGGYLTENAEKDIAGKLADIGIGDIFFDGEGIWVVADGTVQHEMLQEGFFRHMEIGGSDMLMHEKEGRMRVVIDRQEYQKVSQGIDIILYDNVLDKIIDVVGFQTPENYSCIR